MEKSANQKVKLGVFVILGLLLFIAAVYFIGNKKNMFGQTSELTAVFNNVNGLQVGNSVRYSGINVGTVRAIEMENDTVIRVTMILQTKILQHIKNDAVAIISSDGLVGNMIININPGRNSKESVQSGDTITTYSRVKTDDMMETLSVTNENAALLTADLLKISRQIIQGKGTMGVLLNDTLIAKDLKQTLNYIKITTQGTSESVQKLDQLFASLQNENNVIGVLNDTLVAGQLKRTVANLDQSSAQLQVVLTNLNETVTNIKEGDGALNYLSNDAKLVKQIDSTMTNLNEASERLNENLEALKHNYFFKGYFKKQEKAKAKEQKNQ
jgi:phospholipid/cholesterol/gamma-HCH transport system substrate-binding protein